ncbi:hypothetical protein SDC9_101615 [bioreactor metagenome]|uniref:Uncharacterized protein n=1 Tax=bioreactor metagenome TaxID=1076179 RepID=A0A645AVA7_9ZZZZ
MPAARGENPVQEALAQKPVLKHPVLDHRQLGKPCDESRRKQPPAIFARQSPGGINLDPFQPAGRRPFLENETVEPFPGQRLHPFLAVIEHAPG